MTVRIFPKCMSEWGDRLLLFWGLLFLFGVTAVDQGERASNDESITNKADHGLNADQGKSRTCGTGIIAFNKTGKTDPKKQQPAPHRAKE